MVDDVLLNKAASIERCVRRVREEYQDKGAFEQSYTRQDAAILNIQRACEATLDMGQHIIRKYRLGLPQSSRNVFQILEKSAWISCDLSLQLQRMTGFRNIAVHEYQELQIPIVINIIENSLQDFLCYSQVILAKDQKENLG